MNIDDIQIGQKYRVITDGPASCHFYDKGTVVEVIDGIEGSGGDAFVDCVAPLTGPDGMTTFLHQELKSEDLAPLGAETSSDAPSRFNWTDFEEDESTDAIRDKYILTITQEAIMNQTTTIPTTCSRCGAALVNEDCPNYGNGAEHASLTEEA